MQNILIGLFLILAGLAGVFWGYRIFRILLPIYGAIAGYAIALNWLGDNSVFLALIVGIVLAVILAFLAYIWWSVVVTAGGVILGLAVGALLASWLGMDGFLGVLLALAVGVIFGIVMWKIRDELVIIAMVITGASTVTEGVRTVFQRELDIILAVLWIVLVVLGILYQWRRYRGLGLYGFGGPAARPVAQPAMPAAPAPPALPKVEAPAAVAAGAAAGAAVVAMEDRAGEGIDIAADTAGSGAEAAVSEVDAGVIAAGAAAFAMEDRAGEGIDIAADTAGSGAEAAVSEVDAGVIAAGAAAGAAVVAMEDRAGEGIDIAAETVEGGAEAAGAAAEAVGEAGEGVVGVAAAVVASAGEAVEDIGDKVGDAVDAVTDEIVDVVAAFAEKFGLADNPKFKEALEFVEGIGPAFAEKLKALGIVTVLDLVQRGSTRKGRVDVSEASGISSKGILEWVNHADLYRIKGVGSEYADLLEASGVDTVVELAHRNPANLLAKMVEVNEEKKLVRKTPFQSQVDDWVAQAKNLARMIEY